MPNSEITRAVPKRVRESATRGAQLLDERRSGWAQRIDLERIDMASADDCILGQIFNDDYFEGCLVLGLTTMMDVVNNGFRTEENTNSYPALDVVWSELIEERLAVPA